MILSGEEIRGWLSQIMAMRVNWFRKFGTFGRTERDFVTLGIAIAAIILFVATAGSLVPQILRAAKGLGETPSVLVVNAVLLNIALILLIWRRHKQLLNEIEKTRKAEQEARVLARIDPLTGCLNRRSLMPATDRLIAEAVAQGKGLAMIMIDIDNFKQINDFNGHNIGDQVLKTIAERICGLLPQRAVLARLGGDEFACVFPYDVQVSGQVDRFASNLVDSISLPIEIPNKTTTATISLGIASCESKASESADQPDAMALLHRADIAMYHAKKKGKNRYFWFESNMESELRFRNQLIQGVRSGVPRGEFVPFYEQQINLETGELVGFEMLARWQSDEFGMVGPEVFIPIAEDLGLISEMSENLMAQAFEDAKEWDPALSISVNISPVQLRDPWFSHKLLKLLVRHNFPPSRLEIEITESALHDDIGMVRSMIASLQNQGVQVSLDDFGNGYANLAQLRSLPFNRLKIDRNFVKELTGEGSGAKLVQAMVSMGGNLNMPLTAEGIENEEILDLLKDLGQMKGQGYHYGMPEDADAVTARLAASGQLAKETSRSQNDEVTREPANRSA